MSRGPVHERVEQGAAAGDLAVELWSEESRAQVGEERLGEELGVARGVRSLSTSGMNNKKGRTQ